MFTSLVTNKQMGRTNGQTENIMPPAGLDLQRHKFKQYRKSVNVH